MTLVELPSGTVTFLFTDLEGWTRLWDAYPEAMTGTMARHDEILRDGVEGHGGQVIVSNATEELVRDVLPEGVALRFAASVHKLRFHIHEHRDSA